MAERMVEYIGWKDPIGNGMYRMGVTDERIVRCRDCEYFDTRKCKSQWPFRLDGFCAWGEAARKEAIMMTTYPTIKVKRVNPDAPMPTKAHPTDAAYDLCAMEDVTLRPQEYEKVGCGLAFAIPQGWCGVVYPRSGLGSNGLVLKNTVGIIDANYRGEVMLPLYNNNPKTGRLVVRVIRTAIGKIRANRKIEPDGTIHVRKGDRVAQMRIELVPESTMQEVDELDETDRNQGGFGSSGVRGERL